MTLSSSHRQTLPPRLDKPQRGRTPVVDTIRRSQGQSHLPPAPALVREPSLVGACDSLPAPLPQRHSSYQMQSGHSGMVSPPVHSGNPNRKTHYPVLQSGNTLSYDSLTASDSTLSTQQSHSTVSTLSTDSTGANAPAPPPPIHSPQRGRSRMWASPVDEEKGLSQQLTPTLSSQTMQSVDRGSIASTGSWFSVPTMLQRQPTSPQSMQSPYGIQGELSNISVKKPHSKPQPTGRTALMKQSLTKEMSAAKPPKSNSARSCLSACWSNRTGAPSWKRTALALGGMGFFTVIVLLILDTLGVISVFGGALPGDAALTTRYARPGPFGCSNIPLNAPRPSSRYGKSSDHSPTDNDSCPKGSIRYSLTECDVLDAMKGNETTLKAIRPLMPHLLKTTELYDLNCSPNRLATFLAQLRHETNNFQTMYQTLDGGAGSIHMVPSNFGLAIEQIPQLYDVYTDTERDQFEAIMTIDRLKNVTSMAGAPNATPDQKKFVQKVADLIARPEHTFLIAGWWFESGAHAVLGDRQCGDIRVDSDQGIGAPYSNNGQTTGYYQVSRCIFGQAQDPGIEQRVRYFNEVSESAQSRWKCQTKDGCPNY